MEAEFSLWVKIIDLPARCVDDGVAGDLETAAEIIEDTDPATALRYLLDPGSLPGCEILDSSAKPWKRRP